MSLHATWAACAGSVARCIAATTPALADSMFGTMREAGGLSDRGWFRMNTTVPSGYVWLGPNGGDHRYQATPPPDADETTLQLAPAMPRGLLRAEADAFLHDARTLAGGREIAINGGRLPIAPTDAAVAAATSVVSTLEAATALFEPGAVAGLLRDVALRFLRELPQGGPAALATATATLYARRASYGAHAPLWALSLLRATTAAAMTAQSLPPALLYRLFDPFGPGADPELALRKAVLDLAQAGLAPGLVDLLHTLLAQAEAARDRALDSRSVVAHGTALYAAAGDAWAAMRLAEILREASDIPANLERAAISAKQIVLRATHALVVDSINLGSGAALLRHQALIASDGPARADELIETYWFYPRALRPILLTVSR